MPAETVKKSKSFHPDWAKIMDILGKPKQDAIFVNRSLDPETMDGAWDFVAAQKGLGMRRVSADIGKSNTEVETPTAFVFICQCGYARRVIDSEHAFTCERPNASGPSGCGVIWEKLIVDSDVINVKNGEMLKTAALEERIAPKTGRKYMMPKIKGRYIADMVRETSLARKAAGIPNSVDYQPQTFGKKDAEPAKREEPFIVPDAPEASVGGQE